ncbi:MAG: cytochrome c3 family protein [Deltaproteobacteria bacterium]|nr:cytochrome c3 family protein [Deltaproteobacteria bacterium]
MRDSRWNLWKLLATAGTAVAVLAACTHADVVQNPRPRTVRATGTGPLAPIPDDLAASRHAPYENDTCEACHERANPADPGPVKAGSAEGCITCHEEVPSQVSAGAAGRRMPHPGAHSICSKCHNPHNSRKSGLML